MLKLRDEASRCLLCYEPPCSKACTEESDPGRMIRALKFDNERGASEFNSNKCAECEAPCEVACVHPDFPIRIRKMAALVTHKVSEKRNLSIEFCGIKCENPFFLSSSVVASGYEMCAKALEAGWAGIVYKTIGTMRPSEASPRFSSIGNPGKEFIGFKNIEQISDHPLEEDLKVLSRLKHDYPDKVIVGSIMGTDEDDWTELAKMCTEAGCDIIECNFSCPHMTKSGMGAEVGTDVKRVEAYVKAVKKGTNLPVLAKMTPNISNMEVPAIAAVEAGADGLAAINTIKSIASIKLDNLGPEPDVNGKSSVSGLSGNAVKPIALRFIHDMAVCGKLENIPISGMGGIQTWKDAAEFLSLGCSNLQVTTSVMQYGYRIIDDLISGLSGYLAEHDYECLEDFVGSALENIVPAENLERDTVVYPIFDKEKCVGCGRCYVSCYDGGHQAIKFGEDRVPHLDGSKCVGCHLCMLVCPQLAINKSKRVKKTH